MSSLKIDDIINISGETEESRGIKYDDIQTYLCHLHSEVSEIFEELKHSHTVDEIYYEGSDGGRINQLSDAYDLVDVKEKGVPCELADVVILACTIAHRFDIDLSDAINRKLMYNRVRPRR